jgi:16S rRNA (uracil1498-N3)-methyltransferase
VVGQISALPESVARHVRVLRLPAGAPLTLFDGRGGEYDAVLELQGKTWQAEILAHRAVERESPVQLYLAQALVSAEKMDWLVQKAVELGVNRITPILTRRCNVRLSGERSEKRLLHWQGVVVASAEQCGRNRLPVIDALQELEAWLQQLPMGSLRYLLDPEGAPLSGVLVGPGQLVVLAVGPEGGFDPQEKSLLAQHGFTPLRLGPRILRTETAALAMVAALQTLAGDFTTGE